MPRQRVVLDGDPVPVSSDLGTLGQSVYHGLRSGESSEVGRRS